MESANIIMWVVGIGVTVLTFVGSALFAARRADAGKFAALHTRIDEVKDKYVRRDDLDGHIRSLETQVGQLREEQRQASHDVNSRLDTIIATITEVLVNKR